MVTRLISGGRILAGSGKLVAADVLIQDARIIEVGGSLAHPEAELLDARGKIIIPGLVNGHTHGHNNLMKGVADRWALEDLLSWGPALYGMRSPRDHYLSAALGAIEMLRAGCTAAHDMIMVLPVPSVEAMQATVEAYQDVGLRASIGLSMTDIPLHETIPGLLGEVPDDIAQSLRSVRPAPRRQLLEITEACIERWHGAADGRIQITCAPNVPGQCSDELLDGFGELMARHRVRMHTHVAETKVQALHAERRWGRSLVEQLHTIGLLGPSLGAAHGVWLSPTDIDRVAEAGCVVIHNPASNLKLASGIAPVRQLLAAGARVALGTDGAITSDNQNLFEAMRLAALLARVGMPYQNEVWIDAPSVLRMAMSGGAAVLGMDKQLGAVVPGHQADLVLLDQKTVTLSPLHDITNALVYSETGAAVDTVLVDGEVRLQAGRIIGLDEHALLAESQEAAERLRRDNEQTAQLARRLGPYLRSACAADSAQPYPIDRYAPA
jgi:5-methylthioadenosine/S-adenosylhomocysteine deaminase